MLATGQVPDFPSERADRIGAPQVQEFGRTGHTNHHVANPGLAGDPPLVTNSVQIAKKNSPWAPS